MSQHCYFQFSICAARNMSNCFLGYSVTSIGKGIVAVNVQNMIMNHVTLFKDIPIVIVLSSNKLAARLKSLFLRLGAHSMEAPYSLMID